jgi:hypothetical protein
MLRFWSRRKLSHQPFPLSWRTLLEANVTPYRRLPETERVALERRMQVFLAEKRFEGCGGLEVTEAMRVTIAGYACLPLLHDPAGYYPQLGTVVLYPRSFAAPVRETDPLGVVTEVIEERLGESWQEGTVVLAWESIEALLRGESDDCNVILHEFAHQIDARRGLSAGAPLLAVGDRYRDWDELLAGERSRHRSSRRRGRPAILDPYALTSAEELFCVASETFFMHPIRLKANHPDLYAELRAVYGVDPAGWV